MDARTHGFANGSEPQRWRIHKPAVAMAHSGLPLSLGKMPLGVDTFERQALPNHPLQPLYTASAPHLLAPQPGRLRFGKKPLIKNEGSSFDSQVYRLARLPQMMGETGSLYKTLLNHKTYLADHLSDTTEGRLNQLKLLLFIVDAAKRHHIPPLWLALIADQGQWNPSKRGGLMDIPIEQALGQGYTTRELYDPQKNIEFAASYLEMLQRRFPNPTWVLTAYKAGDYAVLKSIVQPRGLTAAMREKLLAGNQFAEHILKKTAHLSPKPPSEPKKSVMEVIQESNGLWAEAALTNPSIRAEIEQLAYAMASGKIDLSVLVQAYSLHRDLENLKYTPENWHINNNAQKREVQKLVKTLNNALTLYDGDERMALVAMRVGVKNLNRFIAAPQQLTSLERAQVWSAFNFADLVLLTLDDLGKKQDTNISSHLAPFRIQGEELTKAYQNLVKHRTEILVLGIFLLGVASMAIGVSERIQSRSTPLPPPAIVMTVPESHHQQYLPSISSSASPTELEALPQQAPWFSPTPTFDMVPQSTLTDPTDVDAGPTILKFEPYTVQKGDWLSTIAQDFAMFFPEDMSLNQRVQLIADSNGIKNLNLIYPGQELLIPVVVEGQGSPMAASIVIPPAPTMTITEQPAGGTQNLPPSIVIENAPEVTAAPQIVTGTEDTVQPSIAATESPATIQATPEAQVQTPVITVIEPPASEAPTEQATEVMTASLPATEPYTIQRGDTLYSIAQQYQAYYPGYDPKEIIGFIMAENGSVLHDPDTLSVGVEIQIPISGEHIGALEAQGIQPYVAQDADSRIAQPQTTLETTSSAPSYETVAPMPSGDIQYFNSADASPPPLVAASPSEAAIVLSPQDVEDLIRISLAEAGGQGEAGIAAVQASILNRVAYGQQFGTSAFGGDTVRSILAAPNQYEPVTVAGSVDALPERPAEQRAMALDILNRLVSGQLADPTHGATTFENRDITMGVRGQSGFSTDAMMAQIEDHTFYNLHAFGNTNYQAIPNTFGVAFAPGAVEAYGVSSLPSITVAEAAPAVEMVAPADTVTDSPTFENQTVVTAATGTPSHFYQELQIPAMDAFPVADFGSASMTHDEPAYWFTDGLHRGQDLFGSKVVAPYNDMTVVYIGPHQLDNAEHTVGKGTAVILEKATPNGYIYVLSAHHAPQTYVENNPNDPALLNYPNRGTEIYVSVGDHVNAGDPIADIHTFGYTIPEKAAPHTHMETFFSPEKWTDANCNVPYPSNAVLLDTTALLAEASGAPQKFVNLALDARGAGSVETINAVPSRVADGITIAGVCDFTADHAEP